MSIHSVHLRKRTVKLSQRNNLLPFRITHIKFGTESVTYPCMP